MTDYIYCRKALARITDLCEDIAEVRGHDDPRVRMYQILCLFRYPIGAVLAIDEYYNAIRKELGEPWRIKLSVESAQDGTVIAKISARTAYEEMVEGASV